MTCLVIGAGVSGLASCRFLDRHGMEAVLYNDDPIDAKVRNELDRLSISCFDRDSIDNLDLKTITRVVTSPGISKSHWLLEACIGKGLEIETEVDLGLEVFAGKVIAVTGTNGKSTVVKMVEHFLNHFKYKAIACGNVGIPVTDAVSEGGGLKALVVELSSYQIEYLHNWGFVASAITSLSPDHLERHGSVSNYYRTKFDLVKNNPMQPCFIHREGKEELSKYVDHLDKYELLQISPEKGVFEDNVLKSMSIHDQMNAWMAKKLCETLLSSGDRDWNKALSSFEPLRYRCEIVVEINGKKVVNDSKSTNLESTMAAAKSFGEDIVLMIGGEAKGESFEPLKKLKGLISKVIVFGSAHKKFSDELAGAFLIEKYDTLEEAMKNLTPTIASLRGALVFSPGAASFDEFQNFEKRGEFFTEKIMKILSDKN